MHSDSTSGTDESRLCLRACSWLRSDSVTAIHLANTMSRPQRLAQVPGAVRSSFRHRRQRSQFSAWTNRNPSSRSIIHFRISKRRSRRLGRLLRIPGLPPPNRAEWQNGSNTELLAGQVCQQGFEKQIRSSGRTRGSGQPPRRRQRPREQQADRGAQHPSRRNTAMCRPVIDIRCSLGPSNTLKSWETLRIASTLAACA